MAPQPDCKFLTGRGATWARPPHMLHYGLRRREHERWASVQKANTDGGNSAPQEGGPREPDRRAGLQALGRQFSRFLAVGVATTIVHYGVLIALVEAFGIGPVLGTTAGFIAAVFLSYLLNRRYTFEVRPEFGSGLIKYYASVSMGLVINAGLMALLTSWGVNYIVAQIIASGAALVWNFIAARFLVFRG